MFKAAVIAFLLTGPAIAAGFPSAECVISNDKSSVMIIGSNPSDTSYSCIASCRANVKDQRAFELVDCKFNLGKNAAEKAFCTKKLSAPKVFSAISPTKMTCAPRG